MNAKVNLWTLLVFSLFVLFSASCRESTKDLQENTEDALTTQLPGSTTAEWSLGGKAFGIFHEVENYDKWKPVFDQDEPRRENSGFQFLDILSSVENENSLAIFFKTPDHKAAKEFISEDLSEKMREAGVSSVPSFIMYDLVFLTTADYDSLQFRVALSYKIRKYDQWYEKFIRDRKQRQEAGIFDIALARSPESPRIVYMMMATGNLEEGRRFMENETMPEKMLEYDVVDDPTFSLWKRAESRTIN